jgi:chromosomal replication initiation ATPase DnaA
VTRQLAFDLTAPPSMRREDFLVAPSNTLAFRTVEGWADWPQGKLALIGPEGSGKTHLALLWAAEAGARVLPAPALAGLGPALAELAAAGRVAIEDADAVAGDPEAERALLHLHNLVLAGGGRLLLTGRQAPARWGVRLPDLASRLAATATAVLEPPDDALLAAVLVKLFADRQLPVSPALIPWLTARMERSLGAARLLVARIDARALAERRAPGRTLAAEVLAEEAAVLDSRPAPAP